MLVLIFKDSQTTTLKYTNIIKKYVKFKNFYNLLWGFRSFHVQAWASQ